MGDKMLALVYGLCFIWFMFEFGLEYILEKLLGNILLLRRNAGKTFTESCNNHGINFKSKEVRLKCKVSNVTENYSVDMKFALKKLC